MSTIIEHFYRFVYAVRPMFRRPVVIVLGPSYVRPSSGQSSSSSVCLSPSSVVRPIASVRPSCPSLVRRHPLSVRVSSVVVNCRELVYKTLFEFVWVTSKLPKNAQLIFVLVDGPPRLSETNASKRRLNKTNLSFARRHQKLRMPSNNIRGGTMPPME